MELMNAWILANSNLKRHIHLPDVVHMEMHGRGIDSIYTITQFSSSHTYSVVSKSVFVQEHSGIFPVCVFRNRNVFWIRKLWDRFVSEGWQRMQEATPLGCALATEAINAKLYRDRISQAEFVDKNHRVFSGKYHADGTGSSFQSDPVHALYFPSNFKNCILVPNHPITGMPYNPNLLSRAPQTAKALT